MPKNKTTKKSESLIIPWITLVISSITLIFVVVSIGYMWYYSAVVGPMVKIAQHQLALQDEVEKLMPVATEDAVVEEELTPLAPKDTEVMPEKVIYEGNGFSYIVPEGYIADEQGLWTEERYEKHINPPAYCDLCQVPDVGVMSEKTSATLESYILQDLDLPGKTLKEMSEQTSYKYSSITLGENNFIKILVSEMMDTTGYYTMKDNRVVAFKVYFLDKDNQELRDIISSLEFN